MKPFLNKIFIAIAAALLFSCGVQNNRLRFQKTNKQTPPTAAIAAPSIVQLNEPKEILPTLVETSSNQIQVKEMQLQVSKQKRRKVKEKSFKSGFRSTVVTNNGTKHRGRLEITSQDSIQVTSKKHGSISVALKDVASFSRLSRTAYIFSAIGTSLGLIIGISFAIDFDVVVGLVAFAIFGLPFLFLLLIQKRYKRKKWDMTIK